MKHEVPSFRESPSSGGMSTPNSTVSDSRDNILVTNLIPGWGWPDEAQLVDFAEQDARNVSSDRAEMVHRMEPTGQLSENIVEYAALYFVS